MVKPSAKRPNQPSSSKFQQNKRFKKKDTDEEKPESSEHKPYINAYKRAELAYQKIQEEKKAAAEVKKLERQKQQEKHEEYLTLRKKMNKALKQKTKKGQPKLGAQMDVLLEKIQRKLREEKEEE
ncbi:unnamed protein product [Bursaphelenchus xylophilus]|uniref:(pine wood nematode) hypothetical protein n=1 Tax=Bursaphelenchus xylophilus TaxID=6326 RepID=A0A1I7S555_BURXY|nr:unnamed protein product [Bursaphelenchus xylophilus]CAG9117721.1 unnamed protein product [Bursaphelenchus xylophilus]